MSNSTSSVREAPTTGFYPHSHTRLNTRRTACRHRVVVRRLVPPHAGVCIHLSALTVRSRLIKDPRPGPGSAPASQGPYRVSTVPNPMPSPLQADSSGILGSPGPSSLARSPFRGFTSRSLSSACSKSSVEQYPTCRLPWRSVCSASYTPRSSEEPGRVWSRRLTGTLCVLFILHSGFAASFHTDWNLADSCRHHRPTNHCGHDRNTEAAGRSREPVPAKGSNPGSTDRGAKPHRSGVETGAE